MNHEIFLLLSIDTITYFLKNNLPNVKIGFPGMIKKKTLRVFREEFGDAVLHYCCSNVEKLAHLVSEYEPDIFENRESIFKFLNFGLQNFKKGDSFLMDVIRTFTFCSYLTLHCYFEKKHQLMMAILSYLSKLYEVSLHEPLNVLGTSSLFDISEQLLEYRNRRLAEEEMSSDTVDESLLNETCMEINSFYELNDMVSSTTDSSDDFPSYSSVLKPPSTSKNLCFSESEEW